MKLVIQSDARIWGGNEKWLVRVAEGLAGRGHDVLVAGRRGAPVASAVSNLGIRTTHARPGGDGDIARALGFAHMLRREAPDVLLLTAFKKSFWGGWAARRAGVPRVVERMGIEQGIPPRWKYRYAFRHYIDAMIVNSRVIRDRWLESAPWYPADEVHVVLNGVTRPTADASTLRAELGIGADVPVVMTAGRLEHRKGMDVLIDAFAQAPANALLVIAGDGPDESALRTRAAQRGIAARARWLGFRSDLPALLAGADVFVLPSRREGMANVVLEAMAAGLLVVTTEVSGAHEAVGAVAGRPTAGWIVPPGAAAALGVALAEAIAAAGSDAPEVAGMRAEVSWRVDHWFSPERMVLETERVLLGATERAG